MLPQNGQISQKKFKTGRNGGIRCSFLGFLLYTGMAGKSGDWEYYFQKQVMENAEKMYLPALTWGNRTPDKEIGEWIRRKLLHGFLW